MSNKEEEKKTLETKKKKGFYAALYSCVGVMLVLAGVIGYNNFTADNRLENEPQGSIANVSMAEDEGLAVGNPNATPVPELGSSYLTPDDRTLAANEKSSTAPTPTGETKATEPPKSTESSKATELPKATESSKATELPKATESSKATELPKATETPSSTDASIIITPEIGTGVEAESENNGATTQTDIEADSNSSFNERQPLVEGGLLYPVENEEIAEAENEESEIMPDTFTSFDDGDKMQWPVLGEVVMEYSVDRSIFDTTLEYYKTNDILCIAAPLGESVLAAADGRVLNNYTTRENGVTVVIDHGNGWSTTYSQLQDDVLVEAGDVVKAGQAIGTVGEPSIYKVLLGTHVGFIVSKDSGTVDPDTILVAK